MSNMSNKCKEIHQIWIEEATGRPLTDGERWKVTRHLEECPACSLEARALELGRIDGNAGPAPALDDLAERRYVDDVLDRAEASPVLDPTATQGRRIPALAWGAAAALVAAVVGVAFYSSHGGDAAESARSGVASEPAAVALEGRVLLTAGDAAAGGSPLGRGDVLREGSQLRVGDGKAVIAPAQGVSVLLEAWTSAAVTRSSSAGVELRLNSGQLVAEVDPARDGPELAIATRAGRVVVTGTAFAVSVSEQRVEVRVYRGSVRVEERAGGQGRTVRVGETAVLGTDGTSRLAGSEQDEARPVLKLLDLLAGREAADVRIQSLPSGAVVTLDDVILGVTPLEAAVRPGHRSLELSHAGFEPVRELLALKPGSGAERVFELGPAVVAPPIEDEPKVAEVVRGSTGSAAKRTGDEATGVGPAELLARAQSARAARDWTTAARTYQTLVQSHPRSAEARTSLVSLGSIQLEHLRRPGKALGSFEAYLARTRKGTLAQEAAFGRAGALRALGRTAREADALRAFLRDFPSAIQANRARQRLSELEANRL